MLGVPLPVLRLGIAAAVLAAVALGAYKRGVHDCEAKHIRAEMDKIEAGQKLEESRRKALIERDELARQVEELLNEESPVVVRCLGPNRVRALNSLDN